MAQTLLIAEDDVPYRDFLCHGVESDDLRVLAVGDAPAALDALKSQPVDVLLADVMIPGMDGLELLVQAHVVRPELRAIVMTPRGKLETILSAFRHGACDFLCKPFTVDELRLSIGQAMERTAACNIEIVSAKSDWVEIRVPCDLSAVDPLQRLLTELQVGFPQNTRETIGSAFREMLNNAIEHGGMCDPGNKVEIKYIRLKRAVMYSIKDPGQGFDLDQIEHAAVSNPKDDPLRHVRIRQQKGLRPGGFGIMITSKAIDELIYNEKRNELIFIKYLPEQDAS